uniref:Uncharacterized protein n=1 Tax=Glossina brevipalpis TaxID=37001 RepID=A0A1A9WCK0_9MUSC
MHFFNTNINGVKMPVLLIWYWSSIPFVIFSTRIWQSDLHDFDLADALQRHRELENYEVGSTLNHTSVENINTTLSEKASHVAFAEFYEVQIFDKTFLFENIAECFDSMVTNLPILTKWQKIPRAADLLRLDKENKEQLVKISGKRVAVICSTCDKCIHWAYEFETVRRLVKEKNIGHLPIAEPLFNKQLIEVVSNQYSIQDEYLHLNC